MTFEDTLFYLLVNLSLALLFILTLGYGALYSFSRFLSPAKGGAMISFLGCIGLMLIVVGELFQTPPPAILTEFESTSWTVRQYLQAYESQWIQQYLTYLPRNSPQYYLAIYLFVGLLLLGYIRVTSKFTYKYAPFVQAEVQMNPKQNVPQGGQVQKPVPAKPVAKPSGGADDSHLARLRAQQLQQEQLRANLQNRGR